MLPLWFRRRELTHEQYLRMRRTMRGFQPATTLTLRSHIMRAVSPGLTCQVVEAMTQCPTPTRTALMPYSAMYAKWPSVTQVLRWFWIAVRIADVRPCFRAATISCSSPYGAPFTTLYTCDALVQALSRPHGHGSQSGAASAVLTSCCSANALARINPDDRVHSVV